MSEKLIKEIVTEWSMKVYNGTPDITNSGHLLILQDILNKKNLPQDAISEIMEGLRNLHEMPDQGAKGIPNPDMDWQKTHTNQMTHSTGSVSAGALDYIDPIQPQDTQQDLTPEDEDYNLIKKYFVIYKVLLYS